MKNFILDGILIYWLVSLLLYPQQEEISSFTIKAKLLNEKGISVANEKLYCFIFIDGIAYSNLGLVNGKAGCIDPNGISNKNGDVKLTVPSEFIKKHIKATSNYTIGILLNGKPVPVVYEGKQVVFDLELVKKSKNVIDFGKVTVKK